MRRLITFSVIIMAAVFTVVGIVKERSTDIAPDISDGLSVIASQYEMCKSTSDEDKILFCADDFEKSLNISSITSITVTDTPTSENGCLCVGDTVVSRGQTISRSNLELLNYRAASSKIRLDSFKFKVNDCEYEMTCTMYFLTRENSAPTIAHVSESCASISTHEGVKVYGRVSAYDPDGDSIRYEIVTYAKEGVLDFDPTTGEYSYTPSGSYYGSDSFEYVAVDKYGNYSESMRVNIDVSKRKTDVFYVDMQGHRSHHSALVLTEAGIMGGSEVAGAIYFMPNKSVSKIDFLAMLMSTIGKESTAVTSTGFDDEADIPETMRGYVREALNMGIINGEVNLDGEHLFYPNRAITRAEAALIVSKLLDAETPTVKPVFFDRADIPAWAEDAIYILNDLGMMDCTDGRIDANKEITRADVADMLCELAKIQ